MRLKTSTSGECRKALSRLVNLTVSGAIAPKVANTAIYGINSILAAIRTDEQESKIDELEKLIEELKDEQSGRAY